MTAILSIISLFYTIFVSYHCFYHLIFKRNFVNIIAQLLYLFIFLVLTIITVENYSIWLAIIPGICVFLSFKRFRIEYLDAIYKIYTEDDDDNTNEQFDDDNDNNKKER